MTRLALAGIVSGIFSAILLTACAVPAPMVSPTHAASDPPPVCGDVALYCAVNPDVTQASISTTICKSGWTATIRPSTSYTEPLKLSQIKIEGLPGGPSDYEEDHRLPLELGGAPRDARNLSPEAYPGSYAKDSDENAYHRQVCDGSLTLIQAQRQFVAKWLAAYPRYRA